MPVALFIEPPVYFTVIRNASLYMFTFSEPGLVALNLIARAATRPLHVLLIIVPVPPSVSTPVFNLGILVRLPQLGALSLLHWLRTPFRMTDCPTFRETVCLYGKSFAKTGTALTRRTDMTGIVRTLNPLKI
ncbi:hypothetical protein [uncultured Cohaesibacter sp.]|uniref:hypothetical protein n=1 Tax=uncultured Cohaesibacter sp. TaxID=1002546 RepID=UPI0029C6C364|nr:hypothetical protein [uncultured Cohaesibacter sp.]